MYKHKYGKDILWRKVFPLLNDLNTQRELGALTLD